MRNYVYILRCRDASLYTGWTNRLPERILAHNEGKTGAKYTHTRRPVTLVYAECFPTKKEAMAREFAIKQLSHKQKEALTGGSGKVWSMGKIFYLMGKSASGKNRIYERLLEKENLKLRPLVIYTTRPIRTGETEEEDYHFIDEAMLHKLRESGKVIEERSYDTELGIWYYLTVDDDTIDLTRYHYLAIGTLQSYRKIRKYYGAKSVFPVYIETEDGERLARALKRERKQDVPEYEEMCRRFLADQKDFSEEKLRRAGIERRFSNSGSLEECLDMICGYISGICAQ